MINLADHCWLFLNNLLQFDYFKLLFLLCEGQDNKTV